MSEAIVAKPISEVKDVAIFLAKLASAGVAAAEDGSIGLGDLPLLLGPITAALPALSGLGEVPSELLDLDAVEAEELAQAVRDNLVFPDHVKEEAVEKIVSMSLEFAAVILMAKKGSGA